MFSARFIHPRCAATRLWLVACLTCVSCTSSELDASESGAEEGCKLGVDGDGGNQALEGIPVRIPQMTFDQWFATNVTVRSQLPEGEDDFLRVLAEDMWSVFQTNARPVDGKADPVFLLDYCYAYVEYGYPAAGGSMFAHKMHVCSTTQQDSDDQKCSKAVKKATQFVSNAGHTVRSDASVYIFNGCHKILKKNTYAPYLPQPQPPRPW